MQEDKNFRAVMTEEAHGEGQKHQTVLSLTLQNWISDSDESRSQSYCLVCLLAGICDG